MNDNGSSRICKGLLRCGKSCRLRWINYLRPDVKRGNFTPQEEETIIRLHNSLGNKWSKIASHLPGRTDNEIKNVWNTELKKRIREPMIKKRSEGDDETSSNESSSMNESSYSSNTTTSIEEKKESQNENEKMRSPLTTEMMISTSDDEVMKEKEWMSVFEMPLEYDIDFWEMLDGLDHLERSQVHADSSSSSSSVSSSSSSTSQHLVIGTSLGGELLDGDQEDDELRMWLRGLEYELDLSITN